MPFLSNIMGLIVARDLPVAKYGPPPQILYGIEPTPEETPWFLFVKLLPLIVIVLIFSFAIGLFLTLRKRKNVKGNSKKR